MIRKLNLLILSALVLTAFAALAASAQAVSTFTVPGASEKTQTTLTMLPDGSGKTAHWVFIIGDELKTELSSLTCAEVRADKAEHDGVVTGSAFTEFTIVTPDFINCSIAGTPVTATNKGCSLTYRTGEIEIVSAGNHLCEHKREPIVFTATQGECTIEIGLQKLTGNFTYHNIEEGGTSLLTVQHGGLDFTYEARGKHCPYGTTSNGTLTTGNSVITAEDGFGMRSFLFDP